MFPLRCDNREIWETFGPIFQCYHYQTKFAQMLMIWFKKLKKFTKSPFSHQNFGIIGLKYFKYLRNFWQKHQLGQFHCCHNLGGNTAHQYNLPVCTFISSVCNLIFELLRPKLAWKRIQKACAYKWSNIIPWNNSNWRFGTGYLNS